MTLSRAAVIVRPMVAETQRRILLAQSDLLLEDVESLRLNDEIEAPLRLREAIRALQIRLGRRNPPLPAATIDAAHDLVFAVQQRLMAANPNNPRPARHVNRPSGQAVLTIVREDRKWKLLALPPPLDGDEAAWLELVEATVERAWDRWCYAQHQAIRATRLRARPLVALAIARAAWDNYWLLAQDAERLRERISAGSGRPAAEIRAARRP